MRKVVLSMYVTLDGVIEEPSWTMPFWSDELAEYARAQLFASDALLLGRVTYQGFANVWPAVTDEQGFADRMNSLPKYVASTTLETVTWNSTLLQADVAEEVARLKQQPGQDILIYGSADLAQTLLPHNLIDELRLWVHPVIRGSGKRLFQESSAPKAFELVDTKAFRSGVVVLSYRPASAKSDTP